MNQRQWLRHLAQRWSLRLGNRRLRVRCGYASVRRLMPPRLEILEERCLLAATIIDLGFAPGDNYSIAYAINDSGQVAGSSGVEHTSDAFFYNNSKATLTNLGTLPGQAAAEAHGINNAGQVVGWSGPDVFHGHAFLYSNGQMTDLGTLPQGTFSSATGIDNAGDVVGNTDQGPFMYSGGQLSILKPSDADWTLATADAINASGQIAASGINNKIGYAGEVLYSNGKVTPLPGVGVPDAMSVITDAISSTGDLAGTEEVTENNAVVEHAFLYRNGQTTDLGTLSGDTESFDGGINSSDQVVGWSEAGASQRAFLYNNGQMIDLNTLLPANSGWHLLAAEAINDSGEVVGEGTINGGNEHAFLMDLNMINVVPTQLNASNDQDSVSFSYQVTGGTTPTPTQVSLYWSSTTAFSGVMGGPLYTQTIAAGTKPGTVGPINESVDPLEAPAGAQFLLLVTDPHNVLGNFDAGQNVKSLSISSLPTLPTLPTAQITGLSRTVYTNHTSNLFPDNVPLTITGTGFQGGDTLSFQSSDGAADTGPEIKLSQTAVKNATTITTDASGFDNLPEGYRDLTVSNADGIALFTLKHAFYVSSLAITSVQINQGVPLDPNSALPAVAEHNTVIRVQVQSNGGDLAHLNPLDIRLRVLKDGVQQGDLIDPTFDPNDPNRYQVQDLGTDSSPAIQYLAKDAFNFYLTPDQTKAGKYTFSIEIDPLDPTNGDFPSKADPAHDLVVSRELQFAESKPLHLLYFSDSNSPQAEAQVQSFLNILLTAYPISADQFQLFPVYFAKTPFTFDESDPEGDSTLAKLANLYNNELNLNNEYQGLVFFTFNSNFVSSGATDAGPIRHAGVITSWNVVAPVSIINMNTTTPNIVPNAFTVAHEVGHQNGLGDTYTGGANPNPYVNPRLPNASDFGNPVEAGNFNTVTRKVAGGEGAPTAALWTDYMGKQPEGGARFTTTTDWQHLYSVFDPQGSASPQAALPDTATSGSDPIYISGTIGTDGTASFGSVFSFTGSGPPDPNLPAGPYSIQLQDKNGNVLASRSFTPLDSLADIAGPVTDMPFALNMDFPAGTAKIVLLNGNQVLATKTVPSQGPTVQIVSPTGGGTLSGNVTINWTGSSPSNSPLTYTLFYSIDGGTTWLPLAADVTGQSFVWDTSQSPGTTTGKIMVVASDGVNRASTVSSGTFTVASKPPVVNIDAPVDGSAVAAGQPLLLQGTGYDPQDGVMPDSSLTWSSNLDGMLGTGSNLWVNGLSAGTNIITLTATDKEGLKTQTSITLQVSSQPGGIQGTAFRDLKGDGTLDPGDPTLAGWTVFLDPKGDGALDSGDPTTQTDSQGHYSFANLAPGQYIVGLVAPKGSAAQVNIVQVAPGSTAEADLPAELPSSTVAPLPTTETTASFTVSWSGTPGTGATSIARYDVFVSDNGGSFTPLEQGTTATSATFMGQPGHIYGFYSVATDNLGDVQSTPVSAQATTTTAAATPMPTPTPTPPSPPPSPKAPPAPPSLNTPPLLALLESLFGGGAEMVNTDGTATVTSVFFGIPLLVANYDSSGNLVGVTILGIDITFLFG